MGRIPGAPTEEDATEQRALESAKAKFNRLQEQNPTAPFYQIENALKANDPAAWRRLCESGDIFQTCQGGAHYTP
jgi:hypothetical protein